MQINRNKTLPRGIRNNNPLNIRVGNVWQGEVKHPTDNQFEQFISIEWGLRAAFVILRRYLKRYGNNTVTKIISSWAPSSENNTQAYINTVCHLTGLQPDEQIRYDDVKTMCSLVSAMAKVECGTDIDDAKILRGYEMA